MYCVEAKCSVNIAAGEWISKSFPPDFDGSFVRLIISIFQNVHSLHFIDTPKKHLNFKQNVFWYVVWYGVVVWCGLVCQHIQRFKWTLSKHNSKFNSTTFIMKNRLRDFLRHLNTLNTSGAESNIFSMKRMTMATATATMYSGKKKHKFHCSQPV